jgi:hypothetical protein
LGGVIRNPSPRWGKVERLATKTARLAEGNFVLPAAAPWLEELRHEMVAFPEGRHDDLVDALVVFLEFAYDNERWANAEPQSRSRRLQSTPAHKRRPLGYPAPRPLG